ncbi:MAG TPA: hypothetical protein VKG25_28285 [Bryobacteraceae bacterium]|nr:hypothetical protein [Bryobacteraceae bacterium]
MQTYTVVGLWDDTGVVYAENLTADGPHEAMRKVAAGNDPPSQILGAIEGSHSFTAACEDSGKAAFVQDLIPKIEF